MTETVDWRIWAHFKGKVHHFLLFFFLTLTVYENYKMTNVMLIQYITDLLVKAVKLKMHKFKLFMKMVISKQYIENVLYRIL